MAQKTIDDQIKSVQREIGMRQRVYAAWVKKGTMTQDQAAHEIACMEAVHRTLMEVRNQRASLTKPADEIERKDNRIEALEGIILGAHHYLQEYTDDGQNATHAKRMLANAISTMKSR